jgi:hypothetical protein
MAGSVLLGTLLAAIIIADARLKTQIRASELRVEACDVADEWLRAMWASESGIPREDEGEVAGREGWRWRTRRVENPAALEMNAEVISLEVSAPIAGEHPPAVRVELLLPREPDETKRRTDAH